MSKTNKHLLSVLLPAMAISPGVNYSQTTDFQNSTATKTEQRTMTTTERNKEIISLVLEQAFNQRKMELLTNVISEDYIGFNGTKGATGFQAPILQLIDGFADARWNIQQIFAEGDKVYVSWKLEGTHTGTWQHIPPTGKKVSVNAMGTYELKNGKIVNAQVLTDRLGLLQELEIVPSDVTKLVVQKSSAGEVRFIDKFLVPAAAKEIFYERVKTNRTFIRNLPGFIEDHAYEHTDTKGNLVLITVALWESQGALNDAKEKVQAEYKREGFDPATFMKKMGIVMDRGIYKELGD
jgi:predicted ester cyclase/heme-degrading monooxygenase HmoA